MTRPVAVLGTPPGKNLGKVCFFARVQERPILDRVEFYAQDIEILRDLAETVVIATRWSEVPWDADLYYIWWWTWAFVPLIKSLLSRKPAVITGTFDLRHGPGGYFDRPLIQRTLMRWSVLAADANIFVSELERTGAEQEFSPRLSAYSPHCVDVLQYRPGQGERDPDLVVTITWLEDANATRKCIAQIIQAIPIVLRERPTARFIIAGAHGSAYGPLVELSRSVGVEHAVEWPGVISVAHKIGLLQRASVYLQPSLYEGFGLAILEAMSCGSPVVVSRVGAVPEVVGTAGVFVSGHDPEEIARGVVSLLGDPDRAADLARTARERAVELFPRNRRMEDVSGILDTVKGRRVRVRADGSPTPMDQAATGAYWSGLVSADAGISLEEVGHPDMGRAFNRQAYQLRLSAVTNAIRDGQVSLPGADVFEAGFGVGFYMDLWRRAGCRRVVGADISGRARDNVQRKYGDFDLRESDISDIASWHDWSELVGQFDLVTAIDVLYHINDDELAQRALASLGQLVRPGGILLFTEKFPPSGTRLCEQPHVVRRPLSWYASVLEGENWLVDRHAPIFWCMDPPLHSRRSPVADRLGRAGWVTIRASTKYWRKNGRAQSIAGAASGRLGVVVDRWAVKRLNPHGNLMMVTMRKQGGTVSP